MLSYSNMKLRGHDLDCASTIYSTHNQIVSTAGHAKWLSEFTSVRCMLWRICGRYCTNLAYVVKTSVCFPVNKVHPRTGHEGPEEKV
jgi:hypothetical protein